MWSVDYSEGTKMWFAQIPLKLGWAHSIYRMRGMTLDHIEVDMRDLYGPGKVYDVLSKVRTLSSVHFISINYSTIKANSDCVVFYGNGLVEWNAAFEKWKGRKSKRISDAAGVAKIQTFNPSDNIPKSAFNMGSLSNICGYPIDGGNKKQPNHPKQSAASKCGQPASSRSQYDDDDDDDDNNENDGDNHDHDHEEDDHDHEEDEQCKINAKQQKREQNSGDGDDDDDGDDNPQAVTLSIHGKKRRTSETSESNGETPTSVKTPETPETAKEIPRPPKSSRYASDDFDF